MKKEISMNELEALRKEAMDSLKKAIRNDKIKFCMIGTVGTIAIIECILYAFSIGYKNGAMYMLNEQWKGFKEYEKKSRDQFKYSYDKLKEHNDKKYDFS